MKLHEYLSERGLTLEAFAKVIEVDVSTVSRYARGDRTPRPAIMRRIGEATGGAVRPQDFYASASDGEAA